jgi:L-ascorbate metabolism protein UlaG (beta-lactamase superfamily)
MRVTHFGHACLLVETGNQRLLFDPGTLSDGFEDLRDLTAVLITHEHDDHLDVGRLTTLLQRNPAAVLVSDRDSARQLDGARVVEPGDRLDLGDVTVDVVGGAHEYVYLTIPDCTNAAYLVNDGEFFHPGDSYFVPEQRIDVLALPTSGPWLRVSDALNYVTAVAPRIAIPMHEAALADTSTHYGMIGAFKPAATEFVPLTRGVAREF